MAPLLAPRDSPPHRDQFGKSHVVNYNATHLDSKNPMTGGFKSQHVPPIQRLVNNTQLRSSWLQGSSRSLSSRDLANEYSLHDSSTKSLINDKHLVPSVGLVVVLFVVSLVFVYNQKFNSFLILLLPLVGFMGVFMDGRPLGQAEGD